MCTRIFVSGSAFGATQTKIADITFPLSSILNADTDVMAGARQPLWDQHEGQAKKVAEIPLLTYLAD